MTYKTLHTEHYMYVSNLKEHGHGLFWDNILVSAFGTEENHKILRTVGDLAQIQTGYFQDVCTLLLEAICSV